MKDLKLSYDDVLNETSEYFGMRNISITGAGYKEIASDPGLLEEYIENLTVGMDSANSAESMSQLLMNANNTALLEASISGITPIASLSMPVIRKLWPKFAMKDALKHEVAKVPRFAVSYQRPYMQKAGGPKIYLPSEIFDKQQARRGSSIRRERLYVDLADQGITQGQATVQITDPRKAAGVDAKIANQPIDKDVKVYIDGKKHSVQTINGATQIYLDSAKTKMVFVNVNRETGDTQLAFVGTTADAVVTAAGVAVDANDQKSIIRGTTGTFAIEYPISEEFNEVGYSVSFDIDRKDIDIPTGQHINAPMPIEWINDNRALYNIDSTKEVVDLMTNVVSQKLDLEVLEFLDDEFEKRGDEANKFSRGFDLRPAAGFAGSPKAWREELKPIIDDLAVVIKDATYFNEGKFSIVGHPRDLNLFQNIDWQFRGGTGTQVDGVNVEYSKGVWHGVYVYEIFSSLNHPQGDMTMIFTPTTNTQYTYKYYPYTFNIEHKYLDPNRPNVPSIMMTKRHTFGSFTPAIGRIYIYNNNGRDAYKQTADLGSAWGTDVVDATFLDHSHDQ